MSKTSKPAETIEFSAFDASRAADQVRALAQKGLEQSQEAYARLKSQAEETQKALEATLETARTVGADLSRQSIAALRDNSEATLSHLEALAGARTFAEVFELQSSFLRQRLESAVEQTRQLQALTSRAADDVSRPIKDVFEKAIRDLKVA
jgi:phasin